jgi:hypothetical protein
VDRRRREIESYFELGGLGVEILEEGLREMTFGEYLVEHGSLTRAELLEALMIQDRNPGIPLGEVIAWLGHLPYPEIDLLLTEWASLPVVEVA